MRALNISLPTGPYDWDPAILPRAEYQRRLDATREKMRAAGVGLLVVHGDGFDHGALTWLTGFTPKLGPSFAFVALDGEPSLTFSGGPGMKPSAQKLTWLSSIDVQRDLAADIGKWIAAHGGAALGLCEGASMPAAAHAAVSRGAGAPPRDLTAAIDDVRRTKSALEIALIEQAAGAAQAAVAALRTAIPLGRRRAIVAAERAAHGAGAQDARVMVADRPGGVPRPLDDRDTALDGAVPVAVATRVRGYWASVESVLGEAPKGLADEARALLTTLGGSLAPGRAPALDPAAARRWILTARGLGSSLEEGAIDEAAPPRAGDAICFRLRLADSARTNLAWSTLAALDAARARIVSPPM